MRHRRKSRRRSFFEESLSGQFSDAITGTVQSVVKSQPMLDYIFSADLDIGHVCITTLFKIVRTTGLDGRSAICPGPRLATVHSSISLMPVPPNWATSLGEVIAKWRSATGAAETYEYMANPPYDKFFFGGGGVVGGVSSMARRASRPLVFSGTTRGGMVAEHVP